MPPDWSRRALLASLGTAALAGCVGETPTVTPHSTPQPTAASASFPQGGPSGANGSTPQRLAADTGDRLGDPPTLVTDSPNPQFYRDGTVYSTAFLPAAVDARPVPGPTAATSGASASR